MTLYQTLAQKDTESFQTGSVIAVGYSTVDVRMSNGAIWRNVKIAGNARKGDEIKIGFDAGKPYAMGGSSAAIQSTASSVSYIPSSTTGSVGGGGLTAHALSDTAIHTGSLADGQAPQFFKSDGTRPITGNVAVNSGVTIDGVDISALAAAPILTFSTDAQLTNERTIAVGNLLLFQVGSLLATVLVDPNLLTITQGKLDKTLPGTLALASASNQTATFLATGNVAIGAGDLSATSVADTSIAAHTHPVVSSSNPGASRALLSTTPNGYVGTVRFGAGLAGDPSYPIHTRSQSRHIHMDYDLATALTAYSSFNINNSGSLNIQSTGDVTLSPLSNVDPDYGYRVSLGRPNKQYLAIHAAELWVQTLVAQDVLSTIGGRILVTPTTKLTRDMSATVGSPLVITPRGVMTTASNPGGTTATITQVGSSTFAFGFGTSQTVSVPSGTLDGHFILAAISWYNRTLTHTQAGWTQIGSDQSITVGGDTLFFRLLYRYAAAPVPGSYGFSLNIADEMVVSLTTYSGVHATLGIDASSLRTNTSSTSMLANSITTTVANTRLVGVFVAGGNSIGSEDITQPAGMTEIMEADQSGMWNLMEVSHQANAAIGATGTRTATITSAAQSLTALIALRPAAASATSIAVPVQAGTALNDLMLTQIIAEGASTINVPGGWYLIGTLSTSSGRMSVYGRNASGSEPANYTWSINTTLAMTGASVSLDNCDITAAVTGFSGQTNVSSTQVIAPSATAVTSSDYLMMFSALVSPGSGAISVTSPVGMTTGVNFGTDDVRAHIATQQLTSPGSTGVRTATAASASENFSALIPIRPEISGGGSTIYVEHNSLAPGHVIYLQKGGATGARVEWMLVTSAPTTITSGKEYSYQVNRNLDGTGANEWNAGDAVADTRGSGSGFIDLYSMESVLGIPVEFIYTYNVTGGVFSANNAMSSDYELFDAVGDMVYYGVEGFAWENVYHWLVTPLAATGLVYVLEYWNGSSWTSVPVTAAIGTPVVAGEFGFRWLGTTLTSGGWVRTTVNGQLAYWVRLRITAGSITQAARQGERRAYRYRNQYGPTIVGWFRNSTIHYDVTEAWAIGNLGGLYDYAGNIFGFAAGRYAGAWVAADATYGFRMMAGTTQRGIIRPNGTWTFSGNGSNYIDWNGTSLVVSGSINVVGISGLNYAGASSPGGAATGIVGQGSLATQNGVDWNSQVSSRPIDNTNRVITAANPGAVGLYLGSTFMGYHNGSQWMTYMTSAGQFVFRGTAARIEWNGVQLSGYNSASNGGGTVQWQTDAITGAIQFGAGNGSLSAEGLRLTVTSGPVVTTPSSITWGETSGGYLSSGYQIRTAINLIGGSYIAWHTMSGGNANNRFYFTGGNIETDGAVYASNWFRTYGDTGWYNETHVGGWYMQDTTYVRSYADKHVITGGGFVSGQPIAVHVYRTSAQNIASGVWTAITFTNAISDPWGRWDGGSACYANFAGYYLLTVKVTWIANAVGFRQIAIVRNGVEYVSSITDTALGVTDQHQSVAFVVYLNAGEYVQTHVYQNSGSSINVGSASTAYYARMGFAKIA